MKVAILVAWIAVALITLLGTIIVVRTFAYGSNPRPTHAVVLPQPPAFDLRKAAARLAQAITFQTITVNPSDTRPQNAEPWRALHRWLEATYPAVHRTMTRETFDDFTLLYTWPGRDAALDPVIFMAHQDVVPAARDFSNAAGEWSHPPFAGAVVDDFVLGRGSIDNKGALIALMEAAEAWIVAGAQPPRNVMLLFAHDEEVGGFGAGAAFQALHARGVRAEMVLDEGLLVIDPSPLTGKRAAMIGIAEKGYLTLELTAHANGGHSSSPERNSATVRLARAVAALDANQMPMHLAHRPVSDFFRNSAPDMPFFTRMAIANQWLFAPLLDRQLSRSGNANALVRTTTAPTMLSGSAKENMMSSRVNAMINFRVHPADSDEAVLAHVHEVTRHIEGLEVRIAPDSPYSRATTIAPTDTAAFAALQAVAMEISERALVTPALVTGATDGKKARLVSDNVYNFWPIVLSPEDTRGIHGVNERLSVANLGRMIRSFAQLMMVTLPPHRAP